MGVQWCMVQMDGFHTHTHTHMYVAYLTLTVSTSHTHTHTPDWEEDTDQLLCIHYLSQLLLHTLHSGGEAEAPAVAAELRQVADEPRESWLLRLSERSDVAASR